MVNIDRSLAFHSAAPSNVEILSAVSFMPFIKGSKTIQSKAEEKFRGDSTPMMSNFDDNAVMIGIAPLKTLGSTHLQKTPRSFSIKFLSLGSPSLIASGAIS